MPSRYVQVAEFKAAPTGVSTADLVAGGLQLDQDVQLGLTLDRAAAWIENYCNQPLAATVRTRTKEIRVQSDGGLVIHPGESPLTALTGLSLGYAANSLTAVPASTLAAAWIDTDRQTYNMPAIAGVAPGSTTIQFGRMRPATKLLAQMTYVSGFASTTLTSSPAAAATSFTVASAAGIVVGQQLRIVDGSKTETVTVSSVAGVTIGCSALANGHTAGTTDATQVAVHAMPDDLRIACIWIGVAMIHTRGNDTLALGQMLQPGPQLGIYPTTSVNIRLAKEVLVGYARRV